MTSLALLTDLYQLTMAYGYWKNEMQDHEAVFHLFFRKNPFGGGYAIACGLETMIDYLSNFRFEAEDLAYLETLTGNDGESLFEPAFLAYLGNMDFDASVKAMPEGTVAFPHEPLVQVRGSLILCQLLETALLNIINFQTLIATKASRICKVAGGEPVLEFGLRRAQGIDGGLSASRAAHIGGCSATSNVLAGKRYGIPVRGTHAHSWVMAFGSDAAAFDAYAATMPNNCIFLVDTYDTIEGVGHAIEVGKQLRERGHEMVGIRLDSGDLAALSIAARTLLDQAGFPQAAIVASNDLDEYRMQQLRDAGAMINVWGIGTRLSTAYDQPALGGVYKLAAIRDPGGEWLGRIKLSEDPIKVSQPGMLQVRRSWQAGMMVADRIIDERQEVLGQNMHLFAGPVIPVDSALETEVLVPVFDKGKRVYPELAIGDMRSHCQAQTAALPDAVKSFENPEPYPVGLDEDLFRLKQALIRNAES